MNVCSNSNNSKMDTQFRAAEIESKRFFSFTKQWPTVDRGWTSELASLDVYFKGCATAKLEAEASSEPSVV